MCGLVYICVYCVSIICVCVMMSNHSFVTTFRNASGRCNGDCLVDDISIILNSIYICVNMCLLCVYYVCMCNDV